MKPLVAIVAFFIVLLTAKAVFSIETNGTAYSAVIVEGAGGLVNGTAYAAMATQGVSFDVNATFQAASVPPFLDASTAAPTPTSSGGGGPPGKSSPFDLLGYTYDKRVTMGTTIVVHHQLENHGTGDYQGMMTAFVDENGNGVPDPSEDQCSYELSIGRAATIQKGCGITLTKSSIGEHTLKSLFVPDTRYRVEDAEAYDKVTILKKPASATEDWFSENKDELTKNGVRILAGLVTASITALLFGLKPEDALNHLK